MSIWQKIKDYFDLQEKIEPAEEDPSVAEIRDKMNEQQQVMQGQQPQQGCGSDDCGCHK